MTNNIFGVVRGSGVYPGNDIPIPFNTVTQVGDAVSPSPLTGTFTITQQGVYLIGYSASMSVASTMATVTLQLTLDGYPLGGSFSTNTFQAPDPSASFAAFSSLRVVAVDDVPADLQLTGDIVGSYTYATVSSASLVIIKLA
ncbi:MAG: hypothetical protein FWF69_06910 [Firmicutes bacterium]|nr:hypothetical protein [Bacillota bacterium]